jgi:hypothetical protein
VALTSATSAGEKRDVVIQKHPQRILLSTVMSQHPPHAVGELAALFRTPILAALLAISAGWSARGSIFVRVSTSVFYNSLTDFRLLQLSRR